MKVRFPPPQERPKSAANWHDDNHAGLEVGKDWFPFYSELAKDVENAWKRWQGEIIRNQHVQGHEWSWDQRLAEHGVNKGEINKNLQGHTKFRQTYHRYVFDFAQMEQLNVLTGAVRKIRRFGMKVPTTEFAEMKYTHWEDKQVGDHKVGLDK